MTFPTPSQKYCPGCKRTLPVFEFHKDRRRRDGLQAHCRHCRTGINARSLARHRANRRSYGKRFRVWNVLLVLKYLREHPCVDCGQSDPLVLDFDHWGKKRRNICSMLRLYTSWKSIEQEISRCEVRCANCHRRKSLIEGGSLKAKLTATGLEKQRRNRLEAGGRRPEEEQLSSASSL